MADAVVTDAEAGGRHAAVPTTVAAVSARGINTAATVHAVDRGAGRSIGFRPHGAVAPVDTVPYTRAHNIRCVVVRAYACGKCVCWFLRVRARRTGGSEGVVRGKRVERHTASSYKYHSNHVTTCMDFWPEQQEGRDDDGGDPRVRRGCRV